MSFLYRSWLVLVHTSQQFNENYKYQLVQIIPQMFGGQPNNAPVNIFSNNNAAGTANNNMFNNLAPQGSNNLLANNAANQNTGSQPAANNSIFTNNANTNNNPPTPVFGGAPNPPAAGTGIFAPKPAANNPIIPTVTNNALGGTQPNQPAGSMFGNTQPTGGNNLLANNNTAGNTAPTGIFPTNNTATQPAGNNLFGQNNTAGNTATNTTVATGGVNVFGNNTPAAGNTAGNAGIGAPGANMFANKGPVNTGTNNLFTANTTNAPSTPPANTTGNTANNTAGNIFNGTNAPNTNAATNPNIFGNKTNPPAGQAGNQPTNPPAANLFANNSNNQPAQGAQGTQGNTNPTANLFGNNQANQGNPSSNSGQNNPVGGNPNQGGMFSNPVNPGPPKDDLESEFQKSNQTVGELIQEYKLAFTNSYEDLKKLAESTLSFLDQREENQRIADNFTEVEKMIGNNNDQVMRTLDSLEKQQEEIAHQLEVMSRKIGEGQYTHELSEHLQEYGELRKLVVQLQEGQGEWNDPSQQQLINIFENLNQVEVQIREMNELVDIYLRDY